MKKYTNTGNKDTRSGFGAGLTELGQKNENVVALCADLIGSLKMDDFKKNHPERFFQVGIAEANMIGMAAGMTIGGKIPYTTTFANFSTSRVYDQIRQSVAYSDKNVKICASHAGLTLGEDGATHHAGTGHHDDWLMPGHRIEPQLAEQEFDKRRSVGR